ncbi:hypothetical protein HYU94_03900 [Candidatus Daviesbacteria bacterium]|nr:hypothetical protein [Candidatus Daviesbacteria bacterium]
MTEKLRERVVGTIGRVRDNLGREMGFGSRPGMYRGTMYSMLEQSHYKNPTTQQVGNISNDHSPAFNTGIAIAVDMCSSKLPVDEFDAYLQFLDDIYSGKLKVFGFETKEETISLILGIEETRQGFIAAGNAARYARNLDVYLNTLLK